MSLNLFDFQQQSVAAAKQSILSGDNILISSPTGCHAKGTRVLKSDGTIVEVQEVQVGERLMGQFGPVTVMALHRGNEEMARVIPIKGQSFVVNRNHVLTVQLSHDCSKGKTGDFIDVSVNQYLNWNDNCKHSAKLVRTPVLEFETTDTELSIDPYFLGILLGDGSLKKAVAVTTVDSEIVELIYEQASKYGTKVRVSGAETYHLSIGVHGGCKRHGDYPRNPVKESLRQLGLDGTNSGSKFIPHQYKTASVENREALLAGLIDSDGYYSEGSVDFSLKSRELADDICFVARSLGLAAYLSPTMKRATNSKQKLTRYWRISISGDTSHLPSRLERKKGKPRKQIKNVLRTGFAIELLPPDDYYGFEVDGNHRYLMGDFTLTHNSGKSIVELKLLQDIEREMGKSVCLITSRNEIISDIHKKSERFGLNLNLSKKLWTPTRFWNSVKRNAAKMPRVVMIDECHHSLAPTWEPYFRSLSHDGYPVTVIGLTATPMRGVEYENPPWRSLFQQYYEAITITKAIRRNYLVNFYLVKEVIGTLHEEQLGTARQQDQAAEKMIMRRMDYIYSVVETLYKRKPCPTVFITPTVASAIKVASYFSDRGFETREYLGTTDKETRSELLTDLAKGKVMVAAVNVLTEGVDVPEIGRVVNLRPSVSPIPYVQGLGRGLRVVRDPKTDEPRFDRKQYCEFVDFTNNLNRFRDKLENIMGLRFKEGEHVYVPDLDYDIGERTKMTIYENYINFRFTPADSKTIVVHEDGKEIRAKVGKTPNNQWAIRLFYGNKYSEVFTLVGRVWRKRSASIQPLDFKIRIGKDDDVILDLASRMSKGYKQITDTAVTIGELLVFSLLRQIAHEEGRLTPDFADILEMGRTLLDSAASPADIESKQRVAIPYSKREAR